MQFAMALLLTMKSGSCLFACEGPLIKSGANMHFKTLEDFESNAMRLLSDDASRVSCVALDFGAEEGLNRLACLPEVNQQRPALQELRQLLERRLQNVT
jgi:hypothetical protein